ncbi:MAG: methyltransferase domain-containing protein [Methanomicrobiales archaeon]|nr:methyltransferase domain-containing protein [Methanomicrobiales archaeon]
MAGHPAAGSGGFEAQRYDTLAMQAIPHPEAFFSSAAEYVPEGRVRVLELASGTGIFTSFIRALRPEALVTCIDRDPAMLAIARGKPGLAGVAFIEGDIRDPWPEGPWDAVAISQCLFALTRGDQKAVLRRAYDALGEYGRFIAADFLRPESAWEEALYRDHLHRFMLDAGMAPGDADAMLDPPGRLPAWYTGATLRSLLESAGFSRTFRPYACGFYAVIGGEKEP